MTVANTNPIQHYTANGISKVFTFDFLVEGKSNIVVSANGVTVDPSEYSYSEATRSIEFNTLPVIGTEITIERKTELVRAINYQSHDNSFRPDVVNYDFDRIWRVLQEKGIESAKTLSGLISILEQLSESDRKIVEAMIEQTRLNITEDTGITALIDLEANKRKEQDKLYNVLQQIQAGNLGNELKNYFNTVLATQTPNIFDGIDTGLIFDGEESQKQINAEVLKGIPSLDVLRAYKPKYVGHRVNLISVNLGQNEGGGEFIATQKAGLIDDNGTIVSSPRNGFYWVRLNNNYVTPEMFGAKGDAASDDFLALQAAFNIKTKPVQLEAKTYKTSKPLELYTGQIVRGSKTGQSVISKYSASKTGVTGRTNPSGSPYNYDQDCAIFFGAWYGWYSYIEMSNITIIKEKVDGEDVGKTFFAPYISMSNFKNIVVKGGEYGFFGEDLWMMNWIRCEAYSKCGFYIGTGTSNTFNTCWSKETKAGYSAWRLNNLVYSTLINCCAEYVGEDGKPAEAAYHITNSDLTLLNCGAENIHAYNLFRINYSWIKISNASCIYGIYNKYRHPIYSGYIDVSSSDSVVSIEQGRFTTNNTGNHADAVRVGGGTFNYDSPMWVGVGFPRDTDSNFKITVSNWAAILDISDFQGRKFTFNGRGKTWENETKTQFVNGILPNALTTTHLNNVRKHIHFGTQNSSANGTVGRGYPSDGFGGSILTFSDDDAAQYSNTVQLALPVTSRDMAWRQAAWGSQFGNWMKFYTEGNTTVDSNGFIKKASPIVKLYADHIELNEEAEKQEISFEKLAIGDYLVKGSYGFSIDGWYIELPQDANGNKLFSVIYKTLENGDISIKTYKRKFDLETASIVADLDTPLDIAEGRWIDLRLNEVAQQ